MVNFDQLNQQTRDYRNTCVDRFNPGTKSNYPYTSLNQKNNQTYKSNNNQYNNYYSYK